MLIQGLEQMRIDTFTYCHWLNTILECRTQEKEHVVYEGNSGILIKECTYDMLELLYGITLECTLGTK